MNIDQVITREEYNSIKKLSYDHFCVLLTRLMKLCVEESLKALPQVVAHISKNAAYLQKLTRDFYKDKNNKDLNEHKRLVAETIEKIEGENPGMSYEDVLDKAAIEARKIIPNLTLKESDPRRNLKTFDSKLKDL